MSSWVAGFVSFYQLIRCFNIAVAMNFGIYFCKFIFFHQCIAKTKCNVFHRTKCGTVLFFQFPVTAILTYLLKCAVTLQNQKIRKLSEKGKQGLHCSVVLEYLTSGALFWGFFCFFFFFIYILWSTLLESVLDLS